MTAPMTISPTIPREMSLLKKDKRLCEQCRHAEKSEHER